MKKKSSATEVRHRLRLLGETFLRLSEPDISAPEAARLLGKTDRLLFEAKDLVWLLKEKLRRNHGVY